MSVSLSLAYYVTVFIHIFFKKISNFTIKTDNSKQYITRITGIYLALNEVACIVSRVQSSCIQDTQILLDKLTGGLNTKFYIGMKASLPCTIFFKWTAAICTWLFRQETMTFPGTVKLSPIAHDFLQTSNMYFKFSVFRVSLF